MDEAGRTVTAAHHPNGPGADRGVTPGAALQGRVPLEGVFVRSGSVQRLSPGPGGDGGRGRLPAVCARGGGVPVLSLGVGTLAMLPFFGMALLVLVLLTWVPVFSTGLPNLILGASR